MKQTQKRRCQSSPEPSSTPPGQSDARTQSDADDTNIAVSDDDQTGQELTNAEELRKFSKRTRTPGAVTECTGQHPIRLAVIF
ncbi:hypothetical protein KEM48_000152 [Puccinia striiformis f. sp. tritici PST-130]|nr:hypothetical protein KEM48_000152 [Puccinia striiformis f. sp. tritici PST-130]